jgi:AcrR family transcriptional regulator
MTKSAVQGERPREDKSRPTSAARGEATRVAILRAAAELIGEEGWAAVTTRAIGARAGVPHGAVSYHFRGREELLREAAAQASADFFAAASAAAASARDGLASVVMVTATAYRDMPAMRAGLATVLESSRQATRDRWLAEQLVQILDSYIADLARLISTDQAAGRIDPRLEPALLARVVAGALDGIALQAAFDPDIDVETVAGAFVELLHTDRTPTDV